MGKLYAKVSLYNDTKAEYVEQDELVDLYISHKDATNGEYEEFIYWTEIPYPDDSYTFTVEHSGYHNVSAGGTYDITHDGFIYVEELESGEVEAKIYSWDEDNSSDIYEDTLSLTDKVDLSRIKSFNGDGTEDTFVLDDVTYHASEFLQWSDDDGATWFYPDDVMITWGSNSPDYDDEIIDSDGHFGIKFLIPPVTGTDNIQIKWLPIRNKCYVQSQFKFPTDNADYTDVRGELRLLDSALEFIE